MGKIVKYCAACEEGFAEKFTYCPNCGAGLTAYAMNPLTDDKASDVWTRAELNQPDAAVTQEFKELDVEPEAPAFLSEDKKIAQPDTGNITQQIIVEPLAEAKNAPGVTKIDRPEPAAEATQEFVAAPVKEPAAFTTAEETADFRYEEVDTQPAVTEQYKPTESFATVNFKNDDPFRNLREASLAEGYNPTIVKESAGPVRQMLLLGAFTLVLTATLAGVVFSLFNANPWVGSLQEDEFISFVPPVEPDQMEPEKPEPKKKDDGGGGGGGGKEEKDPISKGQPPPQMERPMIAPSSHADRVTNPAIPITMATEGKNQRKITDEKYGSRTSTFNGESDGTGTGGGMGSGNGRGVGSGRGTGEGSGIGSGSGSGNGNGNGDGTGDGDGAPPIRRPTPKPTPEPPAGPTEKARITFKPRANYTDPARQNQVQGTVRVRVTLLASGQVGGVSAVNNLPYGLTEQALAAARQIRFEPAKRNGVPTTSQVTVEYNFTLY